MSAITSRRARASRRRAGGPRQASPADLHLRQGGNLAQAAHDEGQSWMRVRGKA